MRIAVGVTWMLVLGDGHAPISVSEGSPRGTVVLQTLICPLAGRIQRRKRRRMCGTQGNLQREWNRGSWQAKEGPKYHLT